MTLQQGHVEIQATLELTPCKPAKSDTHHRVFCSAINFSPVKTPFSHHLGIMAIDNVTSSPTAGLLSLSPELRNEIYGYCLAVVPNANGTVRLSRVPGEAPSVLALLRTCKLINEEASGLFYFLHCVELSHHEAAYVLRLFSPGRCKAIHRLAINVDGVSTARAAIVATHALPRLERLRLIFKQCVDCDGSGSLNISHIEDIKDALLTSTTIRTIKLGHCLHAPSFPSRYNTSLQNLEKVLQGVITRHGSDAQRPSQEDALSRLARDYK